MTAIFLEVRAHKRTKDALKDQRAELVGISRGERDSYRAEVDAGPVMMRFELAGDGVVRSQMLKRETGEVVLVGMEEGGFF